MDNNVLNNFDIITPKITGPRPVVFLLIDSWGIGHNQPGSVFFDLKLKNFHPLVKKYPIALLETDKETITQRYQAMGASGLLTKTLAEAGLSQLNITESEKLVNSWFDFNGGRDSKLVNETLQVISSETGDRQNNPKQVSDIISNLALSAIKKSSADIIFVSLANLDLVTATGNFKAAQEAARALDKNIGKLVNAILKQNGLLIITAAYGRAESMINMGTELPSLGISSNPVPFIIIGDEYEGKTIGLSDPLNGDLSLLASAGTLYDITPTILKILDLPLPENLKGESLI